MLSRACCWFQLMSSTDVCLLRRKRIRRNPLGQLIAIELILLELRKDIELKDERGDSVLSNSCWSTFDCFQHPWYIFTISSLENESNHSALIFHLSENSDPHIFLYPRFFSLYSFIALKWTWQPLHVWLTSIWFSSFRLLRKAGSSFVDVINFLN